MGLTLLVHIAAGALALAAGAAALLAAKGGRLHRRSGILFVYAMLTMAIGGVVIAAGRNVAPSINVPAGLITAYLVVTALTAVRPRTSWSRRLDVGAMLFGFAVGIASIVSGFDVAASADRARAGMAFPLFMFGAGGLLGARSDLRMIRAGGLQGAARLVRHLWRMCLALFIAAGSFFLGQAQVFPEPVRRSGLLPLPVLAVLAAMMYWRWRVRRGSAWRLTPSPNTA